MYMKGDWIQFQITTKRFIVFLCRNADFTGQQILTGVNQCLSVASYLPVNPLAAQPLNHG